MVVRSHAPGGGGRGPPRKKKKKKREKGTCDLNPKKKGRWFQEPNNNRGGGFAARKRKKRGFPGVKRFLQLLREKMETKEATSAPPRSNCKGKNFVRSLEKRKLGGGGVRHAVDREEKEFGQAERGGGRYEH